MEEDEDDDDMWDQAAEAHGIVDARPNSRACRPPSRPPVRTFGAAQTKMQDFAVRRRVVQSYTLQRTAPPRRRQTTLSFGQGQGQGHGQEIRRDSRRPNWSAAAYCPPGAPQPGVRCAEAEVVEKWIYPTSAVYAIRDYQRSIVSRALFRNTLVCLPTGLGKTFIAAGEYQARTVLCVVTLALTVDTRRETVLALVPRQW